MASKSTFDSWIKYRRPNPKARLRLFCFPYAGGAASIFRSWAEELSLYDIELCPVQFPGRENRMFEPVISQISVMVQSLAEAFLPYLNIPFAFFGHSMGTLVAFELAHHLRKEGATTPRHLFVSAHRAPQIPYPKSPIYHLPESEFINEMRQRYNSIPEAVLGNKEIMDLVLPALRADFTIEETYICSNNSPLECPISAFAGTEDNTVGREDIEAWRVHTNSTFNLHMFPGGHFFLETVRPQLLQAISKSIF